MTTKKTTPAIEDEAEELETAPEAVKNEDIEALLPDPEFLELSSGKEVRIRRLKTREALRLLKIITHGGGNALASMDWTDVAGNTEAFAGRLIGIITMSIPNAENETLEFIQSMVEPKELVERPRNKAEKDTNAELWEDLGYDLINPEIEDTVGIITNVVRQEAPDIQALGKRLRAMLPMVRNS